MFILRPRIAVLVLIGMVAALFPPPAEAEMIGLVKRVVYDGYGTPPGLEREEKFARFPVVQDELLETGEDAAMLVEFLDKTLLTLGSKSHLVIDSMVYDANSNQGSMVVTLSVGILRYISGKLKGRGVRINTPSAAIGLRGSDALITVKPDGSTTVNVFEGEFLFPIPAATMKPASAPPKASACRRQVPSAPSGRA